MVSCCYTERAQGIPSRIQGPPSFLAAIPRCQGFVLFASVFLRTVAGELDLGDASMGNTASVSTLGQPPQVSISTIHLFLFEMYHAVRAIYDA